MSEQNQPPRGLFASLRGLLQTALSLAQTRLELLLTELEEERERFFALLLWGAVAFLLLSVGLIFLVIFLTVLLWDSNRLLILGMASAVFLCGGIVAAVLVSRLLARGSSLFRASLGELAQDRVALQRDRE